MTVTRSRSLRILLTILTVLALAGACLWAGMTIGRQSFSDEEKNEPIYAEVTSEELGKSVSVTAQILQDQVPLGQNLLSGVLTARSEADTYAPGDELYRVDGVAVRAVVGSTPFYRDLSADMSGEDVAQLQRLLVELGYLSQADGTFGAATTKALKAWQKANGEAETGVAPRGTLLAVPTLPTQLFVSTEARIGTQLSGSEDMVFAPAGNPRFELATSQETGSQILPGMPVVVHYDGKGWEAVVSETAPREEAGVTFIELTGADGSLVCGQDCASLPAEPQISVSADVTIVEPVSGTAVPVTALSLAPAGQVSINVVGESGQVETRDVEVLSTQGGLSIITNVEAGEKVVLP